MLLCSFSWLLSNLMMALLTETKDLCVTQHDYNIFVHYASRLLRESRFNSYWVLGDDWVHVCLLRAF